MISFLGSYPYPFLRNLPCAQNNQPAFAHRRSFKSQDQVRRSKLFLNSNLKLVNQVINVKILLKRKSYYLLSWDLEKTLNKFFIK